MRDADGCRVCLVKLLDLIIGTDVGQGFPTVMCF
jgi:hypothetical protein